MVLATANTAFASGFEKGINWGAKEASYGGIGVVDKGANALWFNPAGLLNDKAGHQVSFNLSPTWASSSGPIDSNNDSVSTSSLQVVPSLIYDFTVNDTWAFAIGYYAAAGVKGDYYGNSMIGTNNTSNVYGDVSDIELSLGAAYKVNSQWQVGLGYRISYVKAAYSGVSFTSPTNTANWLNLSVQNLSETDYTGYKLGVQYKPAENTKIGLEYRSEVKLNMQGNYGGTVNQGSVSLPIDGSNATLRSTMPMQVVLGAEQDYEKWRALAQYDWTQYSRVGELNVDGSVTANGGTVAVQGGGLHIQEHWNDQHVIRLGGEYMGWSWPLRFGYSWTNQVTDSSYASPAAFPPAMLHTLAVGTGQTFAIMDHPLEFNAAVEYDMSSGSANGAQAGQPFDSNVNQTRAGTVALNIWAMHLNAMYSF